MGGKDSPPPCAASPLQTPRFDRSFEQSASAPVSPATSAKSDKGLALSRKPSPIEYVPRSKSDINLEMPRWTPAGGESSTLPRDCSDGSYSPIRAYMDVIRPQTLKCVLVGDSGVGKTSMLMSYTVNKCPEKHAPTIYDKFSTSLSVYGKRVSVTLCDTAGQDDFAHLRPLCYPQADVAVVCFSVADPTSYENAKSKWVKEIRRHCPGVPVIIVGTQVDKREDPTVVKDLKSHGKRPVSKSEGNKLAAQCKATCYVECSASTSFNIKGAFDEAVAAAMELDSSSKKHTPQCASGCTIL